MKVIKQKTNLSPHLEAEAQHNSGLAREYFQGT
jgi:hypothetical protein